jgi:hypothetical protein
MSAMSEGLIKKEKFTPESCSPGQTSKGMRPKHDNDKIKRKVAKPKG